MAGETPRGGSEVRGGNGAWHGARGAAPTGGQLLILGTRDRRAETEASRAGLTSRNPHVRVSRHTTSHRENTSSEPRTENSHQRTSEMCNPEGKRRFPVALCALSRVWVHEGSLRPPNRSQCP